MTVSAALTLDPIVQRLRALAEDSPDLKDLARLYEIVLPLVYDADLKVKPLSMTLDEARAKIEKGFPLLHDVDLEIDVEAVRGLVLKLVRSMEGQGQKEISPSRRLSKAHASARRLREALEQNTLNIAQLMPHIAAGDTRAVASAAQSLKLDSSLLWTLADNALKSVLHACRRQLAPLLKDIPWHKGSCFICGAAAILGELQNDTLKKHLRCGRCGADWKFARLQCMYCSNQDHTLLSHLYSENQKEKMRVEVCAKCKGYLKVIYSFNPTPPEMLTVEDLATLHLDYAAQAEGYHRPIIVLDLESRNP